MSLFNIEKLYIEITNKCNLKCKHCYNDSNNYVGQEMGIPLLQKILFRVLEYSKIKRILISGGEATTSSNLDFLLKSLYSANIPFTLITNGIFFPPDLYHFFDKKQNLVQISLEGPTPMENDYIRGDNSFYKATATAQKLLDHGISTYFRFSLTSLNWNKIEDMVMLAVKYRMPKIDFSNLFPYGRCKDHEDLYLTNDQLFNAMMQLKDCKKRYSSKIHIDIPTLQKELQVPILIASSPLTCVAEGTGTLLDNINLLEEDQ